MERDTRAAGPLRILIADDEPLARRGIRQLADRHRDVVVAGEARNGAETLRLLHSLAPDILFLDVQMPTLDGFGVIRARDDGPMPVVIFVTAYDTFAVRAFEAEAVDYLVKPVAQARFDAALARARERIDARQAVRVARRMNDWRSDADAPPAAGGSDRRVLVPTPSGSLLLDAAEIDWIGAADYYAVVHTGAREHRLRETLTALAARLQDASFVRVHRSAIVNVTRVREVHDNDDGMTLVLRGGARVPVSRRHREHLTTALRRTVQAVAH